MNEERRIMLFEKRTKSALAGTRATQDEDDGRKLKRRERKKKEKRRK
jgi:hypothetical protein